MRRVIASFFLILIPASLWAVRPVSVYEADVAFALKELETHCSHFFKLKQIDWRKVEMQFLAEARSVKNPQQHLVLLVRLLARLEDGHAVVRPLAKGKNVKWPGNEAAKTGPGMFWCQSGETVLVKNSWSTAERAGVRPGMEIVTVNRTPVTEWLDARIEKLADKISFSTRQQALYYACHWGLADARGSRLQLEVRGPKGRKKRLTVAYGNANPVPWGPAFFPEGITQAKDLNYGKTQTGFGYLHVRRCPGDLPELTDQALAAIGEVPGLILDFRGNSGGGFDHDAFLGRFIPRGKQLAFKKRYRSAGPKPYGGPIVVIVDATVRSAGETAAGIFKEDGRAYMIGESPTAGMASQKKLIELPSEMFALYVSVRSNKLRFNEGRGIEGVGVIPHEIVPYAADDLAGGVDTLIRRAEELLADYPQKDVPYDPAKFGWESALSDVLDIPSEEVSIRGDKNKRYFRIGPKEARRPKRGYGLLVILPGGSGAAEFHPFCKRIYKYICNEDYVAVQPVVVKWTESQRIIWPTQKNRVARMKFTTEQFVQEVIADASKWQKLDSSRVTILAWSSSGPAAYAISLQKKRLANRFLIAMSVFKPGSLPNLKRAKDQAYYLYHSPEDATCPFGMARDAVEKLSASGARVELRSYSDGHGWHGPIYKDLRRGLRWLDENAVKTRAGRKRSTGE